MISEGGSVISLLLGDGFVAESVAGLFPFFAAAKEEEEEDDDDDDDADVELFVFSCISDMRETGVVATA